MVSTFWASVRDQMLTLQLKHEAADLRRNSGLMTDRGVEELVSRVSAKPMVFAVSSGRSGTNALAEIFDAISDVHALHEGRPAFHAIMRETLSDPALARDFLLVRKLPYIADVPEPVFCETSHVFGKAFLPPMLELGLRPSVVFMHRAPRPVAQSFYRIGAIPLRTRNGRQHLLSPGDPSLLPAIGWEGFSDYQLCYWYALETMRRQRVLYGLAANAGCPHRWLRIEDLATLDDVRELLADLQIPITLTDEDETRLRERLGHRYNGKPKKHLAKPLSDPEMDLQEAQVIDSIHAMLPELDMVTLLSPGPPPVVASGPWLSPRRHAAALGVATA